MSLAKRAHDLGWVIRPSGGRENQLTTPQRYPRLIEQASEEDDVGFEAEFDGADGAICPGEQGYEACVDGSQSVFADDVGEAIAGAFGEGFDSFDTTDFQEPLEQRAIGKADAEVAVVETFVVPGDVAAQGEDAMAGDGGRITIL